MIILTFTSCDMVFKKNIERTATFSYLAKRFGYHVYEFYPRTCYKILFNAFKRDYKEYGSNPEKTEILSKVKYEYNKIFIFSLDIEKPQPRNFLNTSFTLKDSKNTIIKTQAFSYATEIVNYDTYNSYIRIYRYEFLLVLEEKLSKKTIEKD